MKFTRYALIVLLFYAFATDVHAEGKTHSVKKDSGDFATIQECVTAAQAGDTCLVSPGDYPERIVIQKSGTSSSPIILKGTSGVDKSHAPFNQLYNPASPQVTPGNPSRNAVTKGFTIKGASHIRIENFEITAILPKTSGAIYLDNSQNIEIVNNFIHDINPPTDFSYNGIYATPNSNTDITVDGNTFWRYQGTGIFVAGRNWVVKNNDISHALDSNTDTGKLVGGDGDGIRFFGSGHKILKNHIHDLLEKSHPGGGEQLGDPHQDCFQTYSIHPTTDYANDILFDGNYCDNVGQGLMSSDTSERNGTGNKISRLTFVNNIFRRTLGNSVIVGDVDYFTFAHNVIAEPRQWYALSVQSPGYSHHMTVVNNIFYGLKINAGPQLTDAASKDGSRWDYNLYYPDFTFPKKQGEFDQRSIFGVDPKFVDPSQGNFRLQENSPAINVGTESGFGTDRDGGARPQGGGWDMGAYESSGAGSVIITPVVTTPESPPPSLTITIKGDFNKDGVVNSVDFSLLAGAWNQSNVTYDLNKDTTVNTLDYSIMAQNWTR